MDSYLKELRKENKRVKIQHTTFYWVLVTTSCFDFFGDFPCEVAEFTTQKQIVRNNKQRKLIILINIKESFVDIATNIKI